MAPNREFVLQLLRVPKYNMVSSFYGSEDLTSLQAVVSESKNWCEVHYASATAPGMLWDREVTVGIDDAPGEKAFHFLNFEKPPPKLEQEAVIFQPAGCYPPCENGGTCVDKGLQKGFECSCADGFKGPSCSSFTSPCQLQPCQVSEIKQNRRKQRNMKHKPDFQPNDNE